MILLKCELDDPGLLTAGHPAVACHLAPSRKPMAFPYVLCVLFYLSDLAAHVLLTSLSPVLQPQHLLTLTYQNNFRLFCLLCLDHHPADTEWLPAPPRTLLSDDTLLIIPIQTTLFTVSIPITPTPLTSFLFLCPHHSHFLTYFVVNMLYVNCTSFHSKT